MIDFWDQTVVNVAANLAFGMVVIGILASIVLLAMFTGLLIRYSVRRIRRWFVENVILAKAETEEKAFRGARSYVRR